MSTSENSPHSEPTPNKKKNKLHVSWKSATAILVLGGAITVEIIFIGHGVANQPSEQERAEESADYFMSDVLSKVALFDTLDAELTSKFGVTCVRAIRHEYEVDAEEAAAHANSDHITKEVVAALISPDCPGLTDKDRINIYDEYAGSVRDVTELMVRFDKDGDVIPATTSLFRDYELDDNEQTLLRQTYIENY